MRHALMIVAAAALLAVASTPASAQQIDVNGRCHDASGRLARMDLCKPKTAKTGGERHLYMRNAQGLCHDEKGRIASQSACKR